MSKQKPTPPPNTPPLKEMTMPESLPPDERGQIQKGLEAIGYAPATGQPLSAEAAQEAMLTALHRRLGAVALDGETSLQALERTLRERNEALDQAQATHNVLGPHANARGILMTHVAESGPDYDTGGRYRVATITVSGGVVDIREIYDLGPNGEPSPVMQYGTAVDHVEKRVDDFLRPKAHRS